MVIESAQAFTLPYPGSPRDALTFVRSPARALARVDFLRGVTADRDGVQGELLVTLPVLGGADLPFRSRLVLTPDGAALEPLALTDERAWVEVHGTARVHPAPPAGANATMDQGTDVDPDPDVVFAFLFRAHLALPDGGGWGGDAFTKMVRAAAGRTLVRVAQDLPAGIAAAMTATPP